MIKETVAEYDLNLGAAGIRRVKVYGYPVVRFDGARSFEIKRVMLSNTVSALDIYGLLTESAVEGMKYQLWTIAFNQTTRGLESAGEIVA